MIADGLNLSDSMPLEDAIRLSLMVRRGSWWQRPKFGSDLHLIDRITTDTPKRAEGMVRRAVAWLVALDRLKDLEVSATVPRSDVLAIAIRAKGIKGQPVSLTQFVPVGVVP